MGERARSRPWIQWLLAGAGLILAAGAAVKILHDRAPATPRRSVNSEAVAMYVQHDGAALRLQWNADAPAVLLARRGTLTITDGAHLSKMELNPLELRSGLASYWPESAEVTFGLDLDGAPAGTVRASATPAVKDPRPSPFQPSAKPRRNRAAALPVKLAPPAAGLHHAPPPKPSRWRRMTSRIPLIRRFKKHREPSPSEPPAM